MLNVMSAVFVFVFIDNLDEDDDEKDGVMSCESVSWCQRNFLLF